METINVKNKYNTVYFHVFCHKKEQRNGVVTTRGISREAVFCVFLKNIYLLILLCQVLVAACKILSLPWSMQTTCGRSLSRSLTRGRTQAPYIGRRVLATGPPGKSQDFGLETQKFLVLMASSLSTFCVCVCVFLRNHCLIQVHKDFPVFFLRVLFIFSDIAR